ncbi:SIS domain-containing protein [Xinfangfangia sp. CPCC 101601]|uniref:Phosphoheptose isomerase n=1 Tax=Pseudogemmobacter lacusdianii TaxID=3069608 RepID=A0ABU0VZX9_9RHOB|nr:SIS domain-containing protein [Xinfangfangia sp. CPCC 101601]MDQ2067259.1 SIS domain-containing protein [Xinfangfangia sp. CPCC 101601]
MDSAVANFIESELAATKGVLAQLYAQTDYRNILAQVAELYIDRLRAGGTLLFCGNGGSAADAQHIAGEFVSRFHFDRPGLAAIALSTDTSILTAIGNDYGYDRIFARQVQALGRRGDVLTVLSTSGNSPNVIKAITAARDGGLTVVGLGGGNGGAMAELCDHLLLAPSAVTPRIQECHLASYHLLCALVEARMFGALQG